MSRRRCHHAQARKLGEGTYGEVFEVGGAVIKVVPMAGSAWINGAPQKRTAEMLAEVRVAMAVSALRAAPGVAGYGPQDAGCVCHLRPMPSQPFKALAALKSRGSLSVPDRPCSLQTQ